MAASRGGVVVLVAEAGAGKTRLAAAAAEAAAAQGCPVLTGRAVPGANPVPYRALVEAFLGAFRSAPVPDSPDLAGFGAHLGRLVPAWRRADGAAEDSPLLLAEAVVRLLRAHGDGPRLCTGRGRPALGRPGDARRPRLPRRRPARPNRCSAWPRRARRAARRSCSNGWSAATRPRSSASPRWPKTTSTAWWRPAWPPRPRLRAHRFRARPRRRHARSWSRSCSPGLVAAGTLRQEDGLWVASDELTPTVPASLRESIRRRLGLLDPTARRVVGAAALLGRRFDWELLPGIADVDGRAVVDALRAAVDEQIVAVDGDGFVFRHALTREAVARRPPAARAAAARAAAWPAIERAHPGLPGRHLRAGGGAGGGGRCAGSRGRTAGRERPPRARRRGARHRRGARRAAPAGSPRPTSPWPATPTRCSFACSSPRASPSRRASSAARCSPGWRPSTARTCWSASPAPRWPRATWRRPRRTSRHGAGACPAGARARVDAVAAARGARPGAPRRRRAARSGRAGRGRTRRRSPTCSARRWR